jgi:hypothetical protein
MSFRHLRPGRRASIRAAVPAALVAAGVMAGSCLAMPGASALTRPTGSSHVAGTVGGSAHAWSRQQTLNYWTPARLRAAARKPIAVLGAGPRASLSQGNPAGKPARVAGGLPHGRGAAALYHGPAARRSRISPAYTHTSFGVPAADYTKYPYSVNGALFVNNPDGNGSCSATVVPSYQGSGNEDEIWTAGHCLVNDSGANQVLDSSAVFIPAYNGNVADFDPFGEFTWNGGWETTGAWYYNRDLTEDEAAMTFGTSSTTGRILGSAVGWDGFAWNWPVNENFTAFGYPAASPYNGKNMIEDIAPTAGQGGASGANPVAPVFIGNPMTPGASGGAWDIDWTTSASGYVDGHNDFTNSGTPGAVYSPYQDTLSNEVRCFGATSC